MFFRCFPCQFLTVWSFLTALKVGTSKTVLLSKIGHDLLVFDYTRAIAIEQWNLEINPISMIEAEKTEKREEETKKEK